MFLGFSEVWYLDPSVILRETGGWSVDLWLFSDMLRLLAQGWVVAL